MSKPKTNTPPYAPEDIFLERRLTDVHLISGHPLAVVAVRQAVEQTDRYESALWTFCLDSGEGRQLTRGPGVDESPRWSPDGRTVAFLSDRTHEQPQLHLIPIDGGEARALTSLACGVQGHAWRPDGRSLLAICPVNVDPDAREEGTRQLDLSVPPREPDQPEVVWRLPYKADGQGYTLGRRTHLVLVDAEDGKATPLTRGDFDVKEAVWAPDGGRIAYAATRTGRGEEHCTDLWLMGVGDGCAQGQPRRMSHEQSMVSAPSWSPDGRWIAFAGSVEAGDAQTRLWLCDVASGRVRPLGDESLEAVPGELKWQPDSRSIAFIRAHRGLQEVATITVPDGQLRTVAGGERHVLYLAAAERLAFVAESLERPAELFRIGWDGEDEQQLSHFNDWRHERTRCVAELRQFTVPDGDGGTERIDGWLLLPAQRKGPVPLLVDVHGGPASIVQLEFNTHVHWYLLCSRGWGVLALNPVGSSSYGRAFCDRLRARWGELDLPQHLAAVRQLQDQGVADARVAVGGSSYGGYLSAWAIGNCDVFRAAVVCAPVGNLETHFGTSDSGYYADPYSMAGKPEEDRELMFELSPMAHIEEACVPTLFLQGKEDERCPKCQSEEMFVKLRTADNTPTEMVLYPGGSHHVFGQGKPSHRLDILRRIVAWLTRWIDTPLPPGKARSQTEGHRHAEAEGAK